MIYYIKDNVKREYFVTVPITYIFSSGTVIKSLDNVGIRILGDMLRLGSDTMSQIWGLTEQDLTEITDFMNHLWSAPDGIRLSPLTPEVSDFLDLEERTWRLERLRSKSPETSLDVLDLPKKIRNSLLKAGIASVEALEEANWDKLHRTPHLGKTTVEQARKALQLSIKTRKKIKQKNLLIN